MINWRFIVELPGDQTPHVFGPAQWMDPYSKQWTMNPDPAAWQLGTLNDRLWQSGPLPKEVPFILGLVGTYVFTLETRSVRNTS